MGHQVGKGVEQGHWRKPGPKPKYDWDRFFDGEEHTLVQGVDFDPTAHSFRTMLHLKAPKYGGWVETKISRDKRLVTFTFYTNGEKPPAPEHVIDGYDL
jgi:hypothetical protein